MMTMMMTDDDAEVGSMKVTDCPGMMVTKMTTDDNTDDRLSEGR